MFEALLNKYGKFEFNYFFNISLKHNYMYVEVPKSGSTSMKKALLPMELDCGGPDSEVENVRRNPHRDPLSSPFIRPFQLGAQAFDTLLKDDGFFKFTVVRNPYSRALSAYLEKVLRGSPQLETLKEQLSKRLKMNADDISGFQVSFPDFLHALLDKKEMMSIDPHFRSQSVQSSVEIIPYNAVFKLEDNNSVVSNLNAISGLQDILLERKNEHSTGASLKWEYYYTKIARDLVIEIYREDFKNFGYSMEMHL